MVDVKQINEKLDFSHGEAPQIQFGDDFDELADNQKILYLKKFSSSMNYAAYLIQQERNKLLTQLQVMQEQVKNADTNVAQVKESLVKVVTESNAEKQQFLSEISNLQREISSGNYS